jgi:Fur family peroxide stress response transcriptional regulator
MWSYTYEDYINVMKKKKLKITASRSAFLKAITSIESKHFTVNEIISKIKESEGHVNIMSVYNILEVLLNEHLLFANTFDGKNVSYEVITPRLVHVRCDYCGEIHHLDGDEIAVHEEWWNAFNELTRKYNVTLEHYKLEAHGICDNCSAKKNIRTNYDIEHKEDL